MHTLESMLERFHAASRKPEPVIPQPPQWPVAPEEIRIPEADPAEPPMVKVKVRKKKAIAADEAAQFLEDEQIVKEEE
jgi:hypothetical protein